MSRIINPDEGNIYTLADLKWISVREFTSVPTGRFYRARNGKWKEETVGVEYITTAGAGRMPLNHWYMHVFEAIRLEGLTELYKQICDHVRAHCAWLHAEKEIGQYAAECLSSGAYLHWKDFGQEKRAVPTAMGTTPEESGCADASTANSIMPNSESQIKRG